MTKKLNIKTALFAGLFGLGIFSNELNANDCDSVDGIKYYNLGPKGIDSCEMMCWWDKTMSEVIEKFLPEVLTYNEMWSFAKGFTSEDNSVTTYIISTNGTINGNYQAVRYCHSEFNDEFPDDINVLYKFEVKIEDDNICFYKDN